uniref:Uncharacterized protein n=1 Tax=Noccaea caerulescens TaxID=107243 RepID=A0A1J3ECQ0_NOCCA
MVSAASKALSFTLGCVFTGFGATALAGYGTYCIGRLVHDVGVRGDARKVPVEELHVTVASMEGKLDNNNNNNTSKTA